MTNKSLSDVSYEWNCSKKEGLSVSVEPASGLLSKMMSYIVYCFHFVLPFVLCICSEISYTFNGTYMYFIALYICACIFILSRTIGLPDTV